MEKTNQMLSKFSYLPSMLLPELHCSSHIRKQLIPISSGLTAMTSVPQKLHSPEQVHGWADVEVCEHLSIT